jgi:hypothetical protein
MKLVRVTFSNGESYGIPAKFVADHRATYYAKKYEGEEGTFDEVYEKEFEETLNDRLELLDWVNNVMSWVDVKDAAVQMDTQSVDKEQEFVNAEKSVVEQEIDSQWSLPDK